MYGALQGTQCNAAVTELICGFDYLRDSRDPRERYAGEVLYEATRNKPIEEVLLSEAFDQMQPLPSAICSVRSPSRAAPSP